MQNICIGLGSNLGNKKANIEKALKYLNETDVIKVIKVSSFYNTTPVGYKEQDNFVNAVCEIKTDLEPEDLLKELKRIEGIMKRDKNAPHWGPRVIDLDILLYKDVVMDTEILIIPHLHLHDRKFDLVPLNEIAPQV
ncbi:2-amino-4-hydroxy-6-hydroxymethyldihydropteridine diphosphokinase, partial [bacterium]|nr:2-amino-4-hydroxy-6-hydroxymethyldihydropteridine diphosphokinase [bacterium]